MSDIMRPMSFGHLMNWALEEYRKAMAGVYSTSVNEDTLDEAPMAYKSLRDITGNATETIDIIEVLRPVYNFKASETVRR